MVDAVVTDETDELSEDVFDEQAFQIRRALSEIALAIRSVSAGLLAIDLAIADASTPRG